jgi:hypothetical protein
MAHEICGTLRSGQRWRVVKGVVWKLAAWEDGSIYHVKSSKFNRTTIDSARHDMAVHRSFCRGEMPAPVYADWLEENGIPVSRDVLDMLRGW